MGANAGVAKSDGSVDGFIGQWRGFAYVMGLACAFNYMWAAAVGIQYPQLDRSLYIFFGIALAIALRPISRLKLVRVLDVVLVVGAAACTLRFNLMYEVFLNIVGMPIPDVDVAFGWFMVIVSIEACRRVLGWAIPVMAALSLLFLYFGPYIPGPLHHIGFDLQTIASFMFAGTDGLYGEITYVLASQMFLFLLFGAFLLRSGASDFFARISIALIGHRPGGTAKAAVASSAIMGSITGSASANAATTGPITIPLMKATGFKAHVAGGIEAAASTGGTILPPVMGTAAFIMVALTGIPYATIALYSALPALLYFLFVYAQIHFYARRMGLSGIASSERPPVLLTLASGGFYLLPLVIVVAMVFLGYSLAFIALLAIASTLLTSMVKRGTRMGPRAIMDAMSQGTQQALPIMVIAGPVSILSQSVLLPGTGLRITGMILELGQGNLAITLALIFVVAYVLGMGLSVVPAYILLATLAAPALIQLGTGDMPAHLLVMWWSQVSNITPPVALAVYVTASIAGAGLWPTGWAAVLKGAGLLILPILFVYQPGLMFRGGAWDIALTIGSTVAGIVICSAVIEGFCRRSLGLLSRSTLGIGGTILLFGHDTITVLIGLVVAAVGFVISERLDKTGPTR